jgi:hypothetical protein
LQAAIDTLRQAAGQMDRVFKEDQSELIPASLALLRRAEHHLHPFAQGLARAVNPELPTGDGVTLATLYLGEFATGRRET